MQSDEAESLASKSDAVTAAAEMCDETSAGARASNVIRSCSWPECILTASGRIEHRLTGNTICSGICSAHKQQKLCTFANVEVNQILFWHVNVDENITKMCKKFVNSKNVSEKSAKNPTGYFLPTV